MDEKSIICLCPACRQGFYNAGCYRIKRVSFMQDAKESCDYCQVRMGFDYYLSSVEPSARSERRLAVSTVY